MIGINIFLYKKLFQLKIILTGHYCRIASFRDKVNIYVVEHSTCKVGVIFLIFNSLSVISSLVQCWVYYAVK